MHTKWHRRGLRKALWLIFLAGIQSAWAAVETKAQATSSSPQSPQPATSQDAPKPVSPSQTQEIASHDSPASFKVRVNLVFVRVVVRDTNGKVIPNLKKEDFQLADNRKLQIISTFTAETPGSHVATVKMDKDSGPAPTEGTPVKSTELPQHFITLFFDDLHLTTQDALLSRQAATKLLAAMKTGDRLSIYTSAGQVQQDFTSERGKLEETLQRILPRPLSGRSSSDCPPMSYYEAYEIVEVNDPTALQVATMDAAACLGTTQGAALLAQMAAQQEYSAGDSETQFSFRNLDGLIARMRSLPGQRIIIMMSPGFFVTPSRRESGDIIDRATRANIVINSIDARGLYVSSIFDVSNGSMNPLRVQFVTTEESVQSDVLAELAALAEPSSTIATILTKDFSRLLRSRKFLTSWVSPLRTSNSTASTTI